MTRTRTGQSYPPPQRSMPYPLYRKLTQRESQI